MSNENTPNAPAIRFAGFTDAWEQRALNQVATVVGGGTPDTNNPNYWNGDIDWYSPSEIGSDVYATKSRKQITSLGLARSSAKLLPANITVLFTSRAGIGDMAILRRDGTTNQGFQSLVLGDKVDTYFVYSLGFKVKRYAEKLASGSTFLEISPTLLGSISLLFPSLPEQRAIGSFFSRLDALIALHQRKYEKLKELKAALLEKMFI